MLKFLNNSSNCSLNHCGGLSTTLCVWLLPMDVQGDDVAVIAVAVKRLGTDIEGTEAALACTIRSCNDSKFWSLFHLLRNKIRVTASAWSCRATENAVGTAAAVELDMVFAAIGISQIGVPFIVEERYRNAATPRVNVDVFYLTACCKVGFVGCLPVGQLNVVYVFVCTHSLFPLGLILQRYNKKKQKRRIK